MKIIYKEDSFDDETISYEQAIILDSYYKIYIDENTNEVIKTEGFYQKEILDVSYYIRPNENEDAVVTELSKLTDIICITRKTQIGDYTIENTNQYDAEKNLIFKSKTLILNNEMICLQRYDLITNQPIFESTTKYYYRSGETLPIFDTTYNEDGSLEDLTYMMDNNEQDWEYYDSDDFYKLQAQFDEDISYYLTANFNPPGIDSDSPLLAP